MTGVLIAHHRNARTREAASAVSAQAEARPEVEAPAPAEVPAAGETGSRKHRARPAP